MLKLYILATLCACSFGEEERLADFLIDAFQNGNDDKSQAQVPSVFQTVVEAFPEIHAYTQEDDDDLSDMFELIARKHLRKPSTELPEPSLELSAYTSKDFGDSEDESGIDDSPALDPFSVNGVLSYAAKVINRVLDIVYDNMYESHHSGKHRNATCLSASIKLYKKLKRFSELQLSLSNDANNLASEECYTKTEHLERNVHNLIHLLKNVEDNLSDDKKETCTERIRGIAKAVRHLRRLVASTPVQNQTANQIICVSSLTKARKIMHSLYADVAKPT